MNLEDDVSRLCLVVVQLTHSNHRLKNVAANQTKLLSRIINVLEIKFDKEVKKAAPAPSGDIMFFSDSMKRWRKDFSLNEMFVRHFADQCFEGYELEKNSSDFKNELASKKNVTKGQHKCLKKAVKVMICFCDSFPGPLPQDPSSLVAWQCNLSLLAEWAMNALADELPDPPKRITPACLSKADIVKDWDNPDSPPAEGPPKDTPNSFAAHFGFDLQTNI